MGLLVALQRFTAEDASTRHARWQARLTLVRAASRLVFEEAMAGEIPLLLLRCTDAVAAEARLRAGNPSVHVNPARLREGLLTINPISLHERDCALLGELLRAALAD